MVQLPSFARRFSRVSRLFENFNRGEGGSGFQRPGLIVRWMQGIPSNLLLQPANVPEGDSALFTNVG